MSWDWLAAPGYWPARLLFQRLLATIYLLGFGSALAQFRGLIGTDGLTPIPRFLAVVDFRRAPSVFHLHYSDRFFAGVCWCGVLVSAAILLGLADRIGTPAMLGWALLWVLYLSIVNVGQTWYSFGWESLLLEAGFLAVFLGQGDAAPPTVVMWLLRWVLFRVEFGAGLIKIRHDRCWRDLTCLYYHHETQPMPNPLSWYFHRLPRPLHRAEVAANHFAQLVVPFGLFAPQPVASVAALVIIATQTWLLLSGNFAWLNLITITLAVAALDGSLLRWLPVAVPSTPAELPPWHRVLELLLLAAVAALSYQPVRNLLTAGQVMNRSFNRLHLVNTYGAFGSITRQRAEVVIEGTDDPHPGPETEWREYEFRGKPGDPRRRPPQVAPYHLRLDWLMWFLAISPSYGRGWFPRLLDKLARNDPHALGLLRHNPFPDCAPRWIRAEFYRYRFTTRAERRRTGAWWQRESLGGFVAPRRSPDA